MFIQTNPRQPVSRLEREPLLADLRGLKGNLLVLGGSFNPPHKGHVEAAILAARNVAADMVIFLPAKQNPLKLTCPEASDEQRIHMLRVLLAPHAGLYVSPLELKRGGSRSYTVDTLREIRSLVDAKAKVFLAFGADVLPRFHEWKEYKEVLKLAEPVLFARDGFREDQVSKFESPLADDERAALKKHFVPIANPCSSTAVRRACQTGDWSAVEEAVGPEVAGFIRENALYR